MAGVGFTGPTGAAAPHTAVVAAVFYYNAGGWAPDTVDVTVPGTTLTFPGSSWLITLPAGTFDVDRDIYVVYSNVGQFGGTPTVTVGSVGNPEPDGSFAYVMPQAEHSSWLHFYQTIRILPPPE